MLGCIGRAMLFAGLGALCIATGCSSASHREVATSPRAAQPQLVEPPRTVSMFGHIRSLTRRGPSYVLGFDPAWLLQGAAARRAAIEDGALSPGDVVTNDFYIRDDGHKLLTFTVPGNAKVTVITDPGPGPTSTPIHVFELARIVGGHRPKRQYVNPRLGFWAFVTGDTVRRLNQQYLPCPPECESR